MNNNKQTLPKDLIMNNRIQIVSTIKNDQTLSAWSQVNSPALNLKKGTSSYDRIAQSLYSRSALYKEKNFQCALP